MPIAKLFIEGNLESEVLNPILQGNPVLQQGGSKNALKPRANTDRKENQIVAAYLRDRDFDYDPPQDVTKPTVDSPVGWRWCRHEIENYLIDPAVVSEAMAWPIHDVEEAIRQAATNIRYYQAARWTIGIVRRALPPHYNVRTRPDGVSEIGLPLALDSAALRTWALSSVEDYRGPMAAATAPAAVQSSFDVLIARFDDTFVTDVARILLWFSGKDLLAGLTDWLSGRGIGNPGSFRASLRDWIIANPTRSLELLPEWNGLIEVVRA